MGAWLHPACPGDTTLRSHRPLSPFGSVAPPQVDTWGHRPPPPSARAEEEGRTVSSGGKRDEKKGVEEGEEGRKGASKSLWGVSTNITLTAGTTNTKAGPDVGDHFSPDTIYKLLFPAAPLRAQKPNFGTFNMNCLFPFYNHCSQAECSHLPSSQKC